MSFFSSIEHAQSVYSNIAAQLTGTSSGSRNSTASSFVDPDFAPHSTKSLFENGQHRRKDLSPQHAVSVPGRGKDIKISWRRLFEIFQRPDDLLSKDFESTLDYVNAQQQYRALVPWVVFHSLKDKNKNLKAAVGSPDISPNSHSISPAAPGFASEISQGALGNCWLLGAFAACGENEASLITSMFVDQYSSKGDISPTGSYIVRVCDGGRWKFTILDDFFPTRYLNNDQKQEQPVFAYSGGRGQQCWSPLLEKAFSKLYGCYERTEGGRPGEALRGVTGFPSKRLSCRQVMKDMDEIQGASASALASSGMGPGGRNSSNRDEGREFQGKLAEQEGFDLAEHMFGVQDIDMSTEEGLQILSSANPNLLEALELLWSRLETAGSVNMIMCLSTREERDKLEAVGLLPNHCYSIRNAVAIYLPDFQTNLRLLQLRNPWAYRRGGKYVGRYSTWNSWPEPLKEAVKRECGYDGPTNIEGGSSGSGVNHGSGVDSPGTSPRSPLQMSDVQDQSMFWITFEDLLKYGEEITISLWRPGWDLSPGSNEHRFLVYGNLIGGVGNSGVAAGPSSSSSSPSKNTTATTGPLSNSTPVLVPPERIFQQDVNSQKFPAFEISVFDTTEVIIALMQTCDKHMIESVTDMGLVLYKRRSESDTRLLFVDAVKRSQWDNLILEAVLHPGRYLVVPISLHQSISNKPFTVGIFSPNFLQVDESFVGIQIIRSAVWESVSRMGKVLELFGSDRGSDHAVRVFTDKSSCGVIVCCSNGFNRHAVEVKTILSSEGTLKFLRDGEGPPVLPNGQMPPGMPPMQTLPAAIPTAPPAVLSPNPISPSAGNNAGSPQNLSTMQQMQMAGSNLIGAQPQVNQVGSPNTGSKKSVPGGFGITMPQIGLGIPVKGPSLISAAGAEPSSGSNSPSVKPMGANLIGGVAPVIQQSGSIPGELAQGQLTFSQNFQTGRDEISMINYIPPRSTVVLQIGALVLPGAPFSVRSKYETKKCESVEIPISQLWGTPLLFQTFRYDEKLVHEPAG